MNEWYADVSFLVGEIPEFIIVLKFRGLLALGVHRTTGELIIEVLDVDVRY